MKRMLTLLVAGLVSVTGTVFAAEDDAGSQWYDIEVVVFRHLAETSGDSEWWPDDPGHPAVRHARALRDLPLLDPAAKAAPDGPRRLSSRRLALSGIVDALEKNEGYEPLLHFGWSQAGQGREEAPLIRVGRGELADPSGSDDVGDGETGTRGGRDGGERDNKPKDMDQALERPPLRRPLDGTLRVAVSRYLHVWADFLFLPEDADIPREDADEATVDAEDADRSRGFREDAVMDALLRGDLSAEEARMLMLRPEETRFLGYRLHQHRRMRSDELHYIDHPRLGIVIRATKREWDGEDAAE